MDEEQVMLLGDVVIIKAPWYKRLWWRIKRVSLGCIAPFNRLIIHHLRVHRRSRKVVLSPDTQKVGLRRFLGFEKIRNKHIERKRQSVLPANIYEGMIRKNLRMVDYLPFYTTQFNHP